MSDNKPDQRFAMLSLELEVEPEMPVDAPDQPSGASTEPRVVVDPPWAPLNSNPNDMTTWLKAVDEASLRMLQDSNMTNALGVSPFMLYDTTQRPLRPTVSLKFDFINPDYDLGWLRVVKSRETRPFGNDDLMISGDNATCIRCGTSAIAMVTQQPMTVVCLGCPKPTAYRLTSGTSLKTSTYRCESCGKKSQVTMTLSDVNLYCHKGCGGRLTLHARVSDGVAVTKKPEQASFKVDPAELMKPRFVQDFPAPPPYRPSPRDTRSFSFQSTAPGASYADSVLNNAAALVDVSRPHVIGSRTVDAPRLTEVIELIRSALGLEDFQDFEVTKIRKNRRSMGSSSPDVMRQTGRTTRALVDVVARCSIETTTKLHVLGYPRKYSRNFGYNLQAMFDGAGISPPMIVSAVADDIEDKIAAGSNVVLPYGVMIYVDHIFYDRFKR